MARISNTLVAIVNIITLIIGLAMAAVGFYLLATKGSSSTCHKALQNPLIITGSILFVVSLLGFFGSSCRNNLVMWFYLASMFTLIVGLIVFTVFVFLVSNHGAGEVVSKRGYKEYKTGDFSNWLQNHFVNGKKWDDIRSCLVDVNVCKSLENRSDSYTKNLSPMQTGCCKPPSECGFELQNATYWIVPKTGPAVNDIDCREWSNEQKTLCYNCNTCKGGVLANIRKEWRHLLIFNVIAILVTIIVYTIGCCARRNNKYSRKNSYRGRHP